MSPCGVNAFSFICVGDRSQSSQRPATSIEHISLGAMKDEKHVHLEYEDLRERLWDCGISRSASMATVLNMEQQAEQYVTFKVLGECSNALVFP